MFGFSLFFVVLFTVAIIVGWRCYRLYFWNYVDVIYYPLAAFGIALLFASTDIQRELLDVSVLAEQQNLALSKLRIEKPKINILKAESLHDANLDHLRLISKWDEICTGVVLSAEANCLAVKKVAPHVKTFLGIASGNFASYEDRLLATCTAGEKLLSDIRTTQAISPMIMDVLLSQYSRAVTLKPHPLDFQSVTHQANQFATEAMALAEQIHRLAFKPDDKSASLMLDIYKAEINYGEIIFLGLAQCISAPRAELSQLKQWASATSTQEAEVTRVEKRRDELKHTATKHRTLLWLQLNLWPIILLIALSLKFAKGVATVRNSKPNTT